MGRHEQTAARQLVFDSSGDHDADVASALERERPILRPTPLCAVCGRHPAHLTLTRQHGHKPAKLCLRCHHAVMQHRKMLRADLSSTSRSASTTDAQRERAHHLSGDAGLIVSRDQRLSAEARHAALDHRRRRAQVAARRVLDLLDCAN
jgi:hypothetical protein